MVTRAVTLPVGMGAVGVSVAVRLALSQLTEELRLSRKMVLVVTVA